MKDMKSILGYSRNSPYKGNPYLDIKTPKGLIDMSETDQDLIGIDNLGNSQVMRAGNSNPYKFKGTTVREIPLQQGGYSRKDLYDYLFEDDDKAPVTAPSEEELEDIQPQHQEEEEDEAVALSIATAYNYETTPRKRYAEEPYKVDKSSIVNGNKAQYAYQFFQGKGLDPHHAAGIVGNLMQESGNFRDDVIEGRRKGDNGAATGIAQWHGDRFNKLKEWAKSVGANPYSLDAQLEYVYKEASDRGDIRKLQKTRNAEEAAYVFAKSYERPKIVDPNRIKYAKDLNRK